MTSQHQGSNRLALSFSKRLAIRAGRLAIPDRIFHQHSMLERDAGSASGPVLVIGVHQQGLTGLLAWTVGLAFVVTAGYYMAKDWLGRKSATGDSRNGEGSHGPPQVKVFALFLLIAILVFALLLATHFVPGT
jgi:hypothetical protein